MKKSMMVATITALLLTLACVTVNVYFPAAEVQQAADRIVEEVQGSQAPANEPGVEPKQSMLERTFRGIPLFEGRAYAQADINVSTPNIRALKESMKERYKVLVPLYKGGMIGETNDGLLGIRDIESLSLKDKALANKVIKAENSDRESLYSEIAKANNIPQENVSDIKELFANSWRKNAQKGWWIQKDNGDWIQKDSE